jgi:hypothetical protein
MIYKCTMILNTWYISITVFVIDDKIVLNTNIQLSNAKWYINENMYDTFYTSIR